MQNTFSFEEENYPMYRNTTLGTTLKESLDLLIQNGKITSDIADRVLLQFDSDIRRAIATRIRSRFSFTARKLHSYRFCDGIWTLMLEDVNFRRLAQPLTADKLKIVACNRYKK